MPEKNITTSMLLLKLNILINTFLQGLSIKEINLELIQAMKAQAGSHAAVVEQVLTTILKVIQSIDELEIYTGGTTNILKYPECALGISAHRRRTF